jgi:hypothetical protein
LAYLPHRNRIIVGHGNIIELHDRRSSQIIELESTVRALAAGPTQTIVAATDRGIVVLDAP